MKPSESNWNVIWRCVGEERTRKTFKNIDFWVELAVFRQKTVKNNKKCLILGIFGVWKRGFETCCNANVFDDLECLNMYVWAAKSLKSQIIPLRRFRSIFADCPVCGFLWIFHCCVYYWKHSPKLTKFYPKKNLKIEEKMQFFHLSTTFRAQKFVITAQLEEKWILSLRLPLSSIHFKFLTVSLLKFEIRP